LPPVPGGGMLSRTTGVTRVTVCVRSDDQMVDGPAQFQHLRIIAMKVFSISTVFLGN
jgi:hypothetical protein